MERYRFLNVACQFVQITSLRHDGKIDALGNILLFTAKDPNLNDALQR